MKKAIIWIVVIVVIVGAIAVRVMQSGNEEVARSIEEIHAAEGVPVDVVTVRTGTITVLREITGLVSGIRQSDLRASADYKIARVVVREGQYVRRGQTLVRFDTDISPDHMARLAQAREAYENARRQVDRLEPLFREGAISESELDAARTQLAIAEADMRNARLELEVVSPIDGIATLVACRAGDAVLSGDVLVQIAVLDSVRVEADVSGETVRDLQAGQSVFLDDGTPMPRDRAATPMGSTGAPGRLTRVALGGNPDTRLFRVEATLENNGELRPGLVVTLDVVVDQVGPVTVVMENALLTDETVVAGSEHDVWVVEDGIARRRAVEVGRVAEGLAEVRSGLSDGDLVVTFGGNRLEDGTRVRFHQIDGVAVEDDVAAAGEAAK